MKVYIEIELDPEYAEYIKALIEKGEIDLAECEIVSVLLFNNKPFTIYFDKDFISRLKRKL